MTDPIILSGDLGLDLLYSLPLIWFLVEDKFKSKVKAEKVEVEKQIQFGLIRAIIPFMWGYSVFLYRWVFLNEDATVSMLIQLFVSVITTWGRWDAFKMVPKDEGEYTD